MEDSTYSNEKRTEIFVDIKSKKMSLIIYESRKRFKNVNLLN